MNSGAVAERAYDALKRQILAGEFGPGQRLEPADLGAAMGISITPVRDALHVLAGEALVETRTSEGFNMPRPTESALRDLYAWNAQVLYAALSHWPSKGSQGAVSQFSLPRLADDLGASTLFDIIAGRSNNREHARTVRSNSERLHAARRAEMTVISEQVSELASLGDAIKADNRAELRRSINSYHRRRLRMVAELIDQIHKV